jgi:hypothetical protein
MHQPQTTDVYYVPYNEKTQNFGFIQMSNIYVYLEVQHTNSTDIYAE